MQAVSLSTHTRWERMAEQSHRFQPRRVVIAQERLRPEIPASAFPGVELDFGATAVEKRELRYAVTPVKRGMISLPYASSVSSCECVIR